jgi:DNA-binding response OmpR family regulator
LGKNVIVSTLTQECLEVSQTTILIVEDDPDVQRGLKIRLKANDYDIICAADGIGCIAEARKHMPDLIILDLGLPAGDGFRVLELLKANDRLSSIPVIVVSARDRSTSMGPALKAGATIFLQKPVHYTEILSVIRKLLDEKSHPREVVHDLGGV